MSYDAGRVIAFLVTAGWAAFVRAEPWPEVKAPPGAQVQSVADDVVLNGRSVRLFRFEVNGSEQEVLGFFRDQFGLKKTVENRLRNEPVIGTRQGDYFLTVQLHPTSSQRTQATVMVTNMAEKPRTSEVSADTRRMLPPDSRVVSTMQSRDEGKQSLMLMALNTNSAAVNRDHLVRALQQRGFRLVRESAEPDARGSSVSLLMNSSTEEAQVTIADAGTYRSVLVNRVREAK